MRHLQYLPLIGILVCSTPLTAAETTLQQFTPKEDIVFSPASMRAFDRSGQHVTHRVLADGSSITELNGSMRSVTVVRMGTDGKIETFCTTDINQAKSWMAGEFGVKPTLVATLPARVKRP